MTDIFEVIAKKQDSWFSETIGEMNNSPVAVRVMDNVAAKPHIHENTDEMFIVLKGKVSIETSTETITLTKGQSYTVTAGTKHRAIAQGRAELIVIGGKDT
ncbi:MAG: cupin domain-containing protein [Pseudomonadales bacterium]|nr:cupin domain-containing protein [Pseudomonadales bacterium]